MQSASAWWSGKFCCYCYSNKTCVDTNPMYLLLAHRQLSDAGMASTRSVHIVRNVTVVTSTSCHSTRRPHRGHCYPGQPYHAHNTLLVLQYGARIVTYFSVVKLWFTLRASARAVAPESPIVFPSILRKRVLQN